MEMLLWLAVGFCGWAAFGFLGTEKNGFKPFHDPSFYFGILPLSLLCPPGAIMAAFIVPLLKKS